MFFLFNTYNLCKSIIIAVLLRTCTYCCQHEINFRNSILIYMVRWCFLMYIECTALV